MILSPLLVLLGLLQGASPRLSATVHWLANTSGRPENHIQNFIEDMSVVYVPGNQFPKPLVLTKSFWDEGQAPNAAYHDGRRIDKNWWVASTNSRMAARGRDTCRIVNFYGRAFLYKLPPPPVGDSAPHVACNDGTTFRGIEDPTAIAFDRDGNLLVADNGPDQDLKILSRTKDGWTIARTFGVRGGVFSGPVPGATGPRRFWGIRGVGVDSAGNVYVGNTGIPMQTMGGTDIRVFSGQDSSLLWQVQGLAFVNSAEAEPGTDGRSVHLVSKRFAMDWNQPPGKSWTFAGVTLDPFRFPDDVRIQAPMATAWIRVIEGRKFLFTTSMRSDYLAVFRFLPGEEIAAPCAVFTVAGTTAGPWMDSIRPTFPAGTPLNRRWAWQDLDGDGRVQAREFTVFDIVYPYVKAIDIADDGTIRLGGRGITVVPFAGLDAGGVPRWNLSRIRKETVPYTEGSGDALRLRYLQDIDLMLVSGSESKYPSFLHAIRNWSDSVNRRQTRIAFPYLDSGPSVLPRLDVNTYDMVLPAGFTADSEFVYVAHGDRGPDAVCVDLEGSKGPKGGTMKCRGEISVLSLATGERIGHLAPDSSVGWYAGATDIFHPLTVTVRADGQRIVFAEEDGKGKIFAYQWCPPDKLCQGSLAARSPPSPKPRWRRVDPWTLQLEGLGERMESQVRCRTLDGRLLAQARSEDGTVRVRLPPASGTIAVEVSTGARRTGFLVAVP
jgi:hypothetical protein